MCIFLILILPDKQSVTAAKALGEPLGVRFGDANIASLIRQLPTGAWPVYATRGHCDCGTRLGCMSHDDSDVEDDPKARFERDLQRRRGQVEKQGWSTAKIERWEAQKRQSNAQHARSEALRKDDTLSLEEWRGLLKNLLEAPGIARVGLLIHMFSGLRDDEAISIAGEQRLRVSQLDDDTCVRLEWDKLHMIIR